MDNAQIQSSCSLRCDGDAVTIKSETQVDTEEIHNDIHIKEEQLEAEGYDDSEDVISALEDYNEEDQKFNCSVCGHVSESEHHWLMHKAEHLHIVMPVFTPPKNVGMDLLVEKKAKPAGRKLSKRLRDRTSDLDNSSDLSCSEASGKRVSRQGHRCRNCSEVFKFRMELLEHCEEKHTPKQSSTRRTRKSVRKSVETNSVLKSPVSRSDDNETEDSLKADGLDGKKHDTPPYKNARRSPEKEPDEPSAESPMQNKTAQQGVRNFICRTCGIVYADVSLLRDHVLNEHMEASIQHSFKKHRFLQEGTDSHSIDTSTGMQSETWIEIDAECPILEAGTQIGRSKYLNDGGDIENCAEIADYNGNMNINFTIRQEDDTNTEDGHRCEECDEKFALRSELELHISTKHIITIFPCPHCEQLFTDTEVLEKHGLEEHDAARHPTAEKPTTPVKESRSPNMKDCDKNFICSMCQMVFTKKKDIRNHIFLAHMVEANADEWKVDTRFDGYGIPAVFICKLCYKEFYIEDDLRQHFAECHKSVKDGILVDKYKDNETYRKANRRKQTIVTKTYDELTILNLKSLKKHDKKAKSPAVQFNILKEFMHVAETSEECEMFKIEMDEKSNKLNMDSKRMVGAKDAARPGECKNFMCPHCQRQFQVIGKLHSHVLKKHSDFYFDGLIDQFRLDETPETQYDSDRKDDTKQQVFTPLSCAICKQEYANQTFLDAHMFNEHIHRCGYCHTVFHSAEHVMKHVLEKHTADETPGENDPDALTVRKPQKKEPKNGIYECHVCDRRFDVWRYLQDHRRRVHKLVNLYKTYPKECALSGCKTGLDLNHWFHKCGIVTPECSQAVVT